MLRLWRRDKRTISQRNTTRIRIRIHSRHWTELWLRRSSESWTTLLLLQLLLRTSAELVRHSPVTKIGRCIVSRVGLESRSTQHRLTELGNWALLSTWYGLRWSSISATLLVSGIELRKLSTILLTGILSH
jgi:hypothetical protein